MAENNRLSLAPVLVINLCSVFSGDGWHNHSPRIQSGYAAGSRTYTLAFMDAPLSNMAIKDFNQSGCHATQLPKNIKCKSPPEDYTLPNCALCTIDALSRLGRSCYETRACLCLCVFCPAFAFAVPFSGTCQAGRRKTCRGCQARFRRPKKRKSR